MSNIGGGICQYKLCLAWICPAGLPDMRGEDVKCCSAILELLPRRVVLLKCEGFEVLMNSWQV